MKFLFEATGTPPVVEVEYYDDTFTLVPNTRRAIVSPMAQVQITQIGVAVVNAGATLPNVQMRFEDVLKPGLIPCVSNVDAYEYIRDLFANYITASRGTGGGGDATAANQSIQISQLANLENFLNLKLTRIKNAANYKRTFTYYDAAAPGSNVTQILHEGTTGMGYETYTETFVYHDVTIQGSNVLEIIVS